MKKLLRLVVLLVLAAAVGCQEEHQLQSGRTLITAKNFNSIAAMQWFLLRMTVDGQPFELTGERPYVQFNAEKNKIGGFASVNRFFGTVQVDKKGRVQWSGPFGSTRMAGSPEMMKQERIFLETLPKTNRFFRGRVYLYAVSDDGKNELVFYVPVE